MPRRIPVYKQPPKPARKSQTPTLEIKHVGWWIVGSVIAFTCLIAAHTPWIIYQIRKPVYEANCEVGKKQDYVLHMIGSQNLTADRDAELLAAVRVASGTGSIPIQELRVSYNGHLIDLAEHPSWDRLIVPLQLQDSAASIVVMHNIRYCNKPEPWTIWPKGRKQFRFPAPEPTEPESVKYAEIE